jgi:hypothetical protein
MDFDSETVVVQQGRRSSLASHSYPKCPARIIHHKQFLLRTTVVLAPSTRGEGPEDTNAVHGSVQQVQRGNRKGGGSRREGKGCEFENFTSLRKHAVKRKGSIVSNPKIGVARSEIPEVGRF